MVLKGHSYTDIILYGSESWKVSTRQIDKYLEEARKRIRNNNNANIEELRAEATSRYLRWMNKLEKEGNIREAAYMQQRIDKINALETITKKIEIKENNDKDLIENLLK